MWLGYLRRKFVNTGAQALNSDRGEAGKMAIEYSPHGAGTPPSTLFRSPERRTVASYEQEWEDIGARKVGFERLSPAKRFYFVKRRS